MGAESGQVRAFRHHVSHCLTARSDESLHTLSAAVRTANIEKRELGWDLDVLEQTAMTRTTDSDDESEDELESMHPTVL